MNNNIAQSYCTNNVASWQLHFCLPPNHTELTEHHAGDQILTWEDVSKPVLHSVER